MPIRKISAVFLLGVILMLLVTACGKPTATAAGITPNPPVSTAVLPTVPKTATPIPATSTPIEATSTPADLSGFVTDAPIATYKEIPVMPGAIAGSQNSTNYLFSVNTSAAEVEAYYNGALPPLGWTPKTGNGTPQPGGVVTLVYYKGQESCIVAIIQQKVGLLVMLGRQAK